MKYDGIFAQGFRDRPFWWDEAPPVDPGIVELPARTDVAIIGGGYTGLNAAIHLARQGLSVTVLEAEQFGWGASTRNAGHVSSGVNLGKGASSGVRSPLEWSMPAELSARLRSEAGSSFTYIEDLVRSNAIDCQYIRSGRFVGAISKRHFDKLQAKLAVSNQPGSYMVEPEDQRAEVGTDHFQGGAVIGLAGQLHPGLYFRGLYDLAERHGATLLAGTPVTGLKRRSDGCFALELRERMLTAEHVLVATNGYTGQLIPWLRRRIVPAASYIIVTEPVEAERMEELLPKFRTVADTRRLLTYFRPTPDRRRILLGGRATLVTKPADQIAGYLYGRLLTIFPQLQGTRLTHAWTGKIAFTFDLLPHVGSHDGVTYCAGCNGSGVAMQSYLGYQAAEAILGRCRSAFWDLGFPTMPLYRKEPWFLPIMTANYAIRDWVDRLR
jgi:glycine/D-amino acid oxidase-like deaminating enzyme